MTEEELIDFVNNDLFPVLKKMATAAGVSARGKVMGAVFAAIPNSNGNKQYK
jgi:type I restriction enzyme M protein